MSKYLRYLELPKDDDKRKYVILSACCLRTIIAKGYQPTLTTPNYKPMSFICLGCERIVDEKTEIKVFTEIKN